MLMPDDDCIYCMSYQRQNLLIDSHTEMLRISKHLSEAVSNQSEESLDELVNKLLSLVEYNL